MPDLMRIGGWLLGMALMATAVNAGSSAGFDEQHGKNWQRNPETVYLTLWFLGGRTEFHPGEVIRVGLGFSCSVSNAYSLDGATYDRSGRLPSEQWHLDPGDRAVDPLASYFEGGSGMGGIRSMPVLTPTPHVILLDLNEWFRLDQPGHYRLYDTSTRIIDLRDPCNSNREQPITSNIIEFEILPPDPAWAEQTLRDAVRTLDGPVKDEQHRAAARTLRFLNTPAAARELVERLGRQDREGEFEYHLGLFSSPHQELIRHEMTRWLTAPDFVVSETFLRDLARLDLLASNPPPLPPWPRDQDEAKLKQVREAHQAHYRKQHDLLVVHWRELLESLPKKSDAARPTCLLTLLAVASDWPPNSQPKDWPDQTAELRAALTAAFGRLPTETQRMLLDWRWSWVKSPALVPGLRQRVAAPAHPGAEAQLHALALKRLYELSPTEGRELILQEIRNPQRGSDAKVLGLLPDQTLPDLDETLAANLEKGAYLEVCGRLVQRYATGAILERVKKMYGSLDRGWACEIQNALLGYFLRVAPEFGVTMTDKALDVQKNGCRYMLLTSVGNRQTAPLLESLAIRRLNDADPETAADAAKYLGRYGSPASKEPLRQRLEEFHAAWKDRADELCYRPGRKNSHDADGQLEYAMVQSLTTAQRWYTRQSDFKALQPFCLTPNSQSLVKVGLSPRPDEFIISHFVPDPSEGWTVGLYHHESYEDLKEKLSQFPAGTVFIWRKHPDTQPEAQEQYDRQFHDLQQFLTEHGMRLEP